MSARASGRDGRGNRRWRAGTAVGVALSLALVPALARSQGSEPPRPDGYAHYWPGSCVQAVQRSRGFLVREGPDTTAYALERDTLPDEVRRVARDCAAQMGAHTAPHELLWLAQLQLAAGDDAAAGAAVAARLSQDDVRKPRPRSAILAQVVDAYLGATPGRVDAVLPYLAQLDTLRGSTAAVGRVRAYSSLVEYYRRVGADTALLRAAVSSLARAGRELNSHDRGEFAPVILTGYRYVAEALALATGTSRAPLAVMAAARADLGKLPNFSANLDRLEAIFRKYGTTAQRVAGDMWVGPMRDSAHPMPGRVMLYTSRPSRLNVPMLRRIAERFPDVDITSAQPTMGYFRDKGPLTPLVESRELEKFFTQELKVPGTVAISWPRYKQLPDGRREAQEGANEQAYLSNYGVTFVVVDRTGVIRGMWIFWERGYEAQIAQVIARYRQP